MDTRTVNEVNRLVEAMLPEIIALRRDLHAHPQVAFKETYAAARVAEALTAAGVEHRTGVATTGVVGWIVPDRCASLPAVGLRADMDALPMQEETGLPYASTFDGCMHACGHDGHTATLVGAARVLAAMADHLPRPVKLFFQPAEEDGSGGRDLVQAGAMGPDFGGVDTALAFALHCRSDLPAGTFGVREGPCCARADEIRIHIVGKGSHAARPEDSRDPIVAAAAVVMNLQTIVSRNVRAVDTAVVTIGQIHGGTKDNIIPDAVTLGGTVRTYDDAVGDRVLQRIEEVVRQTAAGLGCEGRLELPGRYPMTRNDPRAAAYAAELARSLVGAERVVVVPASMGAEDFSYYAQRVPASFVWVGMRPQGQDDYPKPHNAHFDFNDEALAHGIRLLCLLALNSDTWT